MGSLNNVSSDAGIKIDSTTYKVTDSDVLADAANILNDYGNTVVVGTVQNGTVTKISAVINMIEPKVEIKPDIDGLLYSDGKYDKTKFKVNVRLYWDVKKGYAGLGGYQMSDFEGYLDRLSDQAVTIENLTIAQVYEQDDTAQENAFVEFSDGWFSSNIRYSKDINLTLKPGEEKTYEINAKVNEDVKLKKAANLFDFEADAKKSTGSTVNDHLRDTYTLHVTKPVSSVSTGAGISRDTDVNACKNLLNSTTWVCDETPLYEIFGSNSKEIDAIKYEVTNYILSMHAMVDMSTESDNAIAKKLKAHGIDGKKLASAVLGRLGITKSIWNQYKELSDYYTNAKSVKGAVTFHAVGTQGAYAGMDIIITFQIKTGYCGFGSENSAYGGFGTVDYTIKVDEKGKGVPKPKKPIGSGMVTYANYDKFAGHLQKVAEKQIKMLYNIPGKEVDKICDAFCGGTFYKVANQTFGSGSDAVYATVKYMITDNDEAIKNDIKDFTINLAGSGLQKTTKHSIHCPVDVYVDDCEGNQIASIVDNVVTNSSEEIVLYVVGDDKYVVLPSDELYSIRFEGNDTGTMNYEVTEYINSEEQYQYEYKDIPLSNTLHYSNISFDSMGNGKLYDLLKEEEYIELDAVTVNEDSEYYSAVIPAESIRIHDGQSEEELTAIPLAPEEIRQ